MTTLADLDGMDRAGLSQLWSNLLCSEVPPKMSQPMQRRFLAYEIQARHHGGLPPALVARLERIAQGDARKASPIVRPGGRLLRAWNGTTHVVDVLSDAYMWNGTRYRSLSAIARAITGARWSGPRFFGLLAKEGDGPNDAGVKHPERKSKTASVVEGESKSAARGGADPGRASPTGPLPAAGHRGAAR